MAREVNPWNKTFYDRVIQTKIGQGLREQYEQDYTIRLASRSEGASTQY
jgi:hypothetical protein